MKKRQLVIVMVTFFFGSITAFATDKTESFKVYGNCGMCESRIEKAANAVNGVSEADWDVDTKMIHVSYNHDKTSLDAIHKAIAKAGYDTDEKSASDSVYEELPPCCQYTRE